MDFWLKIKTGFKENKKYFISFLSFILIIFLGVLGKSFFFYKEYFAYLVFFLLGLIIIFNLILIKNSKFGLFLKDAIEEDKKLTKQTKEENEKHFKFVDFVIKIISFLIIVGAFIYAYNFVDFKDQIF